MLTISISQSLEGCRSYRLHEGGATSIDAGATDFAKVVPPALMLVLPASPLAKLVVPACRCYYLYKAGATSFAKAVATASRTRYHKLCWFVIFLATEVLFSTAVIYIFIYQYCPCLLSTPRWCNIISYRLMKSKEG